MLVEVLNVNPDGTQELVQEEMPDNWFPGVRAQNQEKIAQLQHALTDTDYKIVKCSEYQLAGLELPYDIAALHAERQALRDQINALEEEAGTNGEHSASH